MRKNKKQPSHAKDEVELKHDRDALAPKYRKKQPKSDKQEDGQGPAQKQEIARKDQKKEQKPVKEQ